MNNDDEKIKPFLKWAGGKMKIVPILIKKFPKNYNRFVEPFLGAGSVSLNVDSPKYIVNDFNSDLILVWKYFKNMGMDFINQCEELFIEKNNKREVFDKFKNEFNETKDELRKAILFIYLNRHCFNGLCRYNGSNKFNVPFGKYEKPYFPREEFEKCYDKVSKFLIYNKDFRDIFKMVKEGDLVYCDPPYIPISESANFEDYASGGFGLEDQIDLARCAREAADNGAFVIISNHYNWCSKQLYTKMFKGKVSAIDVPRTISSKIDQRNSVKEIIAIFN